MELTPGNVLKALSNVIEPDLKKDIVALNLVSDVQIEGNKVRFALAISNPAMHSKKRMEEACTHHLQRILGDIEVEIEFKPLGNQNERAPEQRKLLPGVKNIVAVASGKGGVGKSTVSVNLAVGLAQKGYKVGVIDADIYGPSIPLMFDVQKERPTVVKNGDKTLIKPIESHGVKLLSIGFFAETGQAVVWRGPMATKALNQMFSDADWGELDFMIVDLPPGTGDIHLSLVQAVPLTGAVVVSTPQEVAMIDARKAVDMFKLDQINVPVLGMVENMAYFTPAELPDNKYYIFGKDGVKHAAEDLKVPYLGEIPLVQSIREAGDVGRPAVMQGETPQAMAFVAMTEQLVAEVERRNQQLAPTEKVEITHTDGCATN